MDITQEVVDLLTYLEDQGLSEDQACAVMGMALQSLIKDEAGARAFIDALTRALLEKH
jgi:hypothetical protein